MTGQVTEQVAERAGERVGDAAGAPAVLNPLWIVSLFLGVTEVCVTTAAAVTDGAVQLIFAIFAVTFASVVALLFFVILWWKNHVLYAPRDFDTASSPSEFVAAMRGADRKVELLRREADRRDEVSARAVRRTVDAADVVPGAAAQGRPGGSASPHPGRPGARPLTADDVLETVRRARTESEVRVDLTGVDPKATEPVVLTVTEKTPVHELLDSVYFALSDVVPPNSYGRRWVLEDLGNHQPYAELGSAWASPRRTTVDDRALVTVGIAPGAHLAARRP